MSEATHEPVPQAEGNFLSRFFWTIGSPKQLYPEIARGAPWWQPWIWVSLINMVIVYISLPIQMQIVRLGSGELTEEQLEQTIEGMEKFGFLGVVTAPIVVLLTSLLIAGISYAVVSMLAQASEFKKYLTLYLYGAIVATIGLLFGTIVTLMRGVENIRAIEDAAASFGPAMLIGPGNPILHAVLSTLDVFYIWFYLIIGAGLMHIFGMTKRSAFFAVLPVWLLYVLISLISARLGGMS